MEPLQIFMDETRRSLDKIEHQQQIIHEKLNALYQFKWQIIGGSVVVSGFLSVIITLAGLFFAFMQTKNT